MRWNLKLRRSTVSEEVPKKIIDRRLKLTAKAEREARSSARRTDPARSAI